MYVYVFVHPTKYPLHAQHIPETGLIIGDGDAEKQESHLQGAAVLKEAANALGLVDGL